MRVFVYWNLNKDCYSIRALEGPNKGKVIGHAASVELANAVFSVGHAGRLQVLAGGHKQVHAGIRGTLVSTNAVHLSAVLNTYGMHAITYNPRKHESFVFRATLSPVTTSARVIGLTTDGRADCFAQI